ncbi:MAG: glycosyltransferase [Candidatus Edwardsbacteria bacterium]|nr:glycosyltransferase [Candidatus Edwardsbacteria bacterium]
MRISIVSHAAVIATNQEKLVALSVYPDLELQLIAPAYWPALHLGQGYRAYLGNAGRFAVHAVPVTPNVKNISYLYYPAIYRHLRDFRPDLVQFEVEPYCLTALQGLMLARAVGAKYALLAWQNLVLRFPWPVSAIERAVLRGADGILTGNHDGIDVLRAKGYRGPAVVAGQGYDPSIRPAVPADRARLRARLGLDRFTIGYAGRLTEQKGLRHLLEASARVARPHRLLIVGEGPARAGLVRRAGELGIDGRVLFTGALPEHRLVHAYLSAMDLFVLPSVTMPKLKEQFGLVLVEAMVCGVPVIGSASGEIPNIVGDAGLVVPEGDPAALAAAIDRVMAGAALRRSMIAEGRARARRQFSWNAVAERSHAFYRQLAGR